MMKPALICFSVLTSLSLWFAAQDKQPITCSGKPIPIILLPGPKMTGPELPLRFGGTRPYPRPPINSFRSENAVRLVIKNRDEFSDLWGQFIASVQDQPAPSLPAVDFSKEMVIVAAMGAKPSCCYWTFIDGVCEANGQVEVFVSSVDDVSCFGQFPVETFPADAVRIPRTDLPIVFRETKIPCTQWAKQIRYKD